MSKRQLKKAIAAAVGIAALVWLYRRHRRSGDRTDSQQHIEFTDAPVAAPTVAETPAPTGGASTDPRRVTVCECASVIPIEGWSPLESDPNAVPANLQVTVFTRGGQPLQQQAPTSMIIFSVEDVRILSLTPDEYVKRCISVAVEQAMAMSGGRIRPRITVNEKCSVGPFTHLLEYVDDSNDGGFRVTTYLCLKGTTGLSLQKMSPDPSLDPGLDALRTMAESVEVDLPVPPVPFTSHYFIRRYIGTMELKTEPLWTMRPPSPALALIATVEGDMLHVFRGGDVPPSYLSVPEDASFSTDGVHVSQRGSATVYATPSFAVVHVPPTSRPSTLATENIAAVVKSIRPVSAPPEHGRDVFVAVKERMSFAVEPKGCVIPPQHATFMNYLPLHNPMLLKTPPTEATMVSCGVIFDPMKASLDEWAEFLIQSGVGRPQRIAMGKYTALSASQKHEEQPAIMTTIVLPSDDMSYCFQWESHAAVWESMRPMLDVLHKSLRVGDDCDVS